MQVLQLLEPEIDTAALTGGNPAHRVLLVANMTDETYTGWARLAVDFQTRSRYAIQISSACGDICNHIITDEQIGEPSLDTGKFRWAFTLWFEVTLDANTLVGYLAAWSQGIDHRDAIHLPDDIQWLPALEAQPHEGRLSLPISLPVQPA